jgi:hypothetical protein
VNERFSIAVVFAGIAFVTALLPAAVIGGLAQDVSFIALPIPAALFAALWSAILGGVSHSSKFGYLRGLAVVALTFICVLAVFAAMRPLPYGQALVALLIVGWGFMVFPGLVGGFVAVWFLRHFGHEPNSTVERDGPQAARPSR